MRSTGSGSMITPVENGSTCSGAQLELARQRDAGRARARQAVLAGAGVGVAGVDHQRADAAVRAPGARGTTCTGAAQKRFCVNTPADRGALVDAARPSRSLRLALRTPASATPSATPGTGDAARAGSGAERFDGHGRSSLTAYQVSLPWQCLNFLPVPQGHGSLRPTCARSAAAPALRPPARRRRWLSSSTRTSTSPVSVGAV